jgi:hypothetical protein
MQAKSHARIFSLIAGVVRKEKDKEKRIKSGSGSVSVSGSKKKIGMAFGHEKLDRCSRNSASEGMLGMRTMVNTERQKSTPIPIPTPTPKEAH